MSPQRREQRPCQRPRLLLMTSREGGPGEAHRRGTSVRSAQPSGLTTRTGSRRIPRERSGMTTLWGGTQRHGLRHRPWASNRWEPRGAHRRDVGANYTTTGLDGSPETCSCGASDYDGSANAASHVEVHTAGAHVPVGMHETCNIEDVPGADYDPRHGSRDPGAQWRAPYHRQATTRTAYPTGVPLSETSCGCRASRS